MKMGSLRKFLGIEDDADVYALLDLAPDQCTVVRIDEALRRRIQQVYVHPDGRGPEGDDVRRLLRAAATSLKTQATRTGLASASIARTLAPPPLTKFDRHVLAVLVANGGWNALSRERLVALAASQGATVHGLIKVIRGLGEYARAGGGRMGVSQITAGRYRFVPEAPAAPPPSSIAQFSEKIVEHLVPKLKDDSPEGTVKLSLFFGLLTLLIAVIAVVNLYPEQAPRVSIVTEGAEHIAPSVGAGELRPQRPERGARPDPEVRPAPFAELPAFADAGVPRAATEAAEGVADLIDELDEIARRLIVATEPGEIVYRKWEYAIHAIAGAWPLLDGETTRKIEQAMNDVLLAAAGRPGVIDRILSPLAPAGEIIVEPLDVWRGAWRAGMLARLSRNPAMPPAVSEHAVRLLEIAVGIAEAAGARDFGGAAELWLRRITPSMVERMGDGEKDYLSWELWLGAQRWLAPSAPGRASGGAGPRFERAIMHAVRLIVRSRGDLSRQTGRLNVLGCLLRSVSFTTSSTVRDMFLELIDDPDVSATNLWVLTSILAQDPQVAWFGGEFVIPHDASTDLRRRFQYDLERLWPHIEVQDSRWVVPGGRGRDVQIDDYVHRLWLDRHDEVASLSQTVDDEERMRRLLDWARLNEAAALLHAHRPAEAERPLRSIPVEAPRASPRGPSPTNPHGRGGQGFVPGGEIGPDGAWAARYEEARRSNEDRMRVLESLRAAGRDLEPRNAALLVREAYRAPGGSPEVRSLAQSFVARQFPEGVNIAIEMLDQFPEAPRSEATSEFLQEYTKTHLPPARQADWTIEARRALLEHALHLLAPEAGAIDSFSNEIAESYVAQTASLRSQEPAAGAPSTGSAMAGLTGMGGAMSPTDAAHRLVEAWRDAALAALVVSPFPDDVPGLDRRHAMRLRLAEGPIQEFIASQVTVFELLLYLTTSEQPGLREELATLAHEAAEQRRAARDALEQAVICERAISALWRIRLGPAPPGYMEHRGLFQ